MGTDLPITLNHFKEDWTVGAFLSASTASTNTGSLVEVNVNSNDFGSNPVGTATIPVGSVGEQAVRHSIQIKLSELGNDSTILSNGQSDPRKL